MAQPSPSAGQTPAAGPLRLAVIGTGAFGRNHLRVYRELEAANPEAIQLAALVEPDDHRRASLADTYNIPAYASVTELLAASTPTLSSRPEAAHLAAAVERPATPSSAPQAHAAFRRSIPPIDAASICVPTIHHAAVAEQLLLAGIDILIEKPFAATLAEADRLCTLARERDRILAVGHLERFNPAVTATLAALNRPMFFEAHRLSIFTPRSLDVDVVLDLMIHDLDIVLALTDSPVREVRAVGLPVLSRKTDIANVRIEFESGCIANFTASRVSTEQVRKLRLFQPHQYLSLDFARQELLTISVDPAIVAAAMAGLIPPPTTVTPQPTAAAPTAPLRSAGSTTPPPSVILSAAASAAQSKDPESLHTAQPAEHHAATTPHPSPGLSLEKSTIPKAEPLRLELEDFLQAVRTRTQPRVPAEAGRAALALALEINEHIATHAKRIEQRV